MSDPAQLGSGHPPFSHHDHHHVGSSKKSEQKDEKTTSALPSKTPETDEKICVLSADILSKSTDLGSSAEIDDPLFSLLYGSSSSESTSSEFSSLDFASTDDVFKQFVKNQTAPGESVLLDPSYKPPLLDPDTFKTDDLATTSPIDRSTFDLAAIASCIKLAAKIDKALSEGAIVDFLRTCTPELLEHAKFMLPTETGFEDIHHSQIRHVDLGKLSINLHKIGRAYASDGLSIEEKERLQNQVRCKVTFVNAQLWITLCTNLNEALLKKSPSTGNEDESDTPKQSIKVTQSPNPNQATQEKVAFQKDNREDDLKRQYHSKISSLSYELKKSLARIAALDEQIRLFRQIQKEKKADEKEKIYLEKEILKEEIKRDTLKREIQKYEIKQKRLI